MATTIGGALRAVAVAANVAGTKPDGAAVTLGARIFRRKAPDGATLPYVTFVERVTDVPTLIGDGKVKWRERGLQFNLWQRVKDESDDLLTDLEGALDGAQLTVTGTPTVAARLTSTQDIEDPDPSLVHHALIVTVKYGTMS